MLLRHNYNDSFIEFISSEDALFHYTKKNIVFENILYSDCFKLSTFKNSNDPQEYKDPLIEAAGWGWEESTHPQIDQTQALIEIIIRNQTCFGSFCINKFNNDQLESQGFLKSRMWSQYGEGHEGICLVFSKKIIIKTITESINDNEFLFFKQEMKYNNSIRDGSGPLTVQVNGDSFKKESSHTIAVDHIINHYDGLFFTKQNDYKDEKEYRIIVCKINDENHGDFTYHFPVSNCLKGIILGDRFHKNYRPLIEPFKQKLELGYRQLHWESGEYTLLNQL